MKKLTIAMLAILVASSVAMATDTRVATIGGASAFLKDYTDIYMLPSVLSAYPRMISAELGTAPAGYPYYGSASITWTNNEEQTWGVMGIDVNHAIHGEQAFEADLARVNLWIAPSAIPMPDNKFHLFYAKKFGTMTAGLHLARAAGSATGEYADSVSNTKGEASSGILLINAGLSMSPMENVELDAAFSYQMLSFKGDTTHTQTLPAPAVSGSTTIENDGGSQIMFGARAFYGMSDQLKIVPAFGINMYSLGYKTAFTGADTSIDRPRGGKKSATNVAGAFGVNYQPAENVTVVGGLHLGFGSTTVEDTNGVFVGGGGKKATISTMTLPGFSAAVEAKLVKWLAVRFGASKMLSSTTTEDQWHSALVGNVTTKSTTTAAPYAFSFGLGLTFGNLKIDGKLGDDQPFDLGYLMSGNPNPVFTQVSATYKF